MSQQPTILVVGSINMDLAVRASRLPLPGETLLGSGFACSPGGKGGNQAVAVARLGGTCRMLGRVGDDLFGRQLMENLTAEGVHCDDLLVTTDASSGVAMIVVDTAGENAIIVDSGANAMLTPDDIFDREETFAQADLILLQLELPLPTVRAAMEIANRHHCKIMLDPAPVPRTMPDELLQVDILSPNAGEAEAITGVKIIEERLAKNVALDLIARGARTAVLKLGSRGSLVVMDDGHFYSVPAHKVIVEDTTGAGDAFSAAFALAAARGESDHHAAKVANAAGAIACTRLGAQSAMPRADEVKMLMDDQPL